MEKRTNGDNLLASGMEKIAGQFSQAAETFSGWLSLSSGVSLLIDKFGDALSELKDANTLLTEIGRNNSRLSGSQIKSISENAFPVASRYGMKSSDYLSGVQEAALAGYEDVEAIAELSLAARNAGSITADLANRMILAADEAYRMGGSVTELTEVLDGMNNITNHNTLTMADLSEGMSAVSSTAASLGVGADEAAAALGTMIAATRQDGSEAADAFQAILLHIRQIADAEQGIDATGLAEYEAACNALNVKLKETGNGVLSLRDPMEVLKELSDAYNRLGDTDSRKAGLLDAVGGDSRAEQLDALLSGWETYESMVQQYADGAGSMAAEAEKTADSWEGSLNRLSNTWTDTIGNIAGSDAVITIANGLNSLLSVVNNVTGSLGSLGTISLGAGLFAGIKNVGRPKMYGLNNCFEYADNNMRSLGY